MRIEWARRPFFFLAILFCVILGGARILKFSLPKPAHSISNEIQDSRSIILGGTIVSEIETRMSFPGNQRSTFILRTRRLWNDDKSASKNVQGRVRVSWSEAPFNLSYGEEIILEGELRNFLPATNPAGFNAREYWMRQNVEAGFYAKENSRYRILRTGRGTPSRRMAIRVKRAISDKLTADFPGQEGAFLKALFLGERSDLDQDFRDLFLKTGTSHILAVSGFNVTFVIGVLWIFLKPLKIHRDLRCWIFIAAVWTYCYLVGWQAPVLRASVMVTLFLLGQILGRKSDGLNSLGLAACLILIVRPNDLFDLGFQLSFVAVLALILCGGKYSEELRLLPHERYSWKEKASKHVQDLFWATFAAYFATLPLVIQNFYLVTPYVFFANFIVVPVTFLLFLLVLPYIFLPPVLGAASLMKFLLGLLTHGLFFLENSPGAVWICGRLNPFFWILLCAGIGWILLTSRLRWNAEKFFAMIFFCALILFAQEMTRSWTRSFRMVLFDVGQGDALYFEWKDGSNMLVDGGSARFSDSGRWVIGPYLKSKGVRHLDAILISHPQEDHVGGLLSIFKDFDVSRVIESGASYNSKTWSDVQRAVTDEKAMIQTVHRGDTVTINSDAKISILHPDQASERFPDVNESSVVAKIQIQGTSFLLTGDIGEKTMKSLLNSGQDLKADVLKVPHHGARVGEIGAHFFKAVGPQFSLISAGRHNPFGHPNARTLEALELPENHIFRTDLSGAAQMSLRDGKVRLDSK